MKFIDTHSHLYSSKFDQDRRKVIKDAINLGVEKFLLPNISSKYTKRMNDLCAEFPSNCFPIDISPYSKRNQELTINSKPCTFGRGTLSVAGTPVEVIEDFAGVAQMIFSLLPPQAGKKRFFSTICSASL